MWTFRALRLARHFLFESGHEPGMDVWRHRIWVHAPVDLDSFLSRIADYPAIRAFVDVLFELRPDFGVRFLVQIIAKFVEELFTCKQRRHLPCV